MYVPIILPKLALWKQKKTWRFVLTSFRGAVWKKPKSKDANKYFHVQPIYNLDYAVKYDAIRLI